MYEFTCAVCGKVKQVDYEDQVGIYCSRECAYKGRTMQVNAELVIGECIFQPEAVMCYKRDCINCGWNPVVAKSRLDEFRDSGEVKVKSSNGNFQRWISVSERLPEIGEKVLVCGSGGGVYTAYLQADHKWRKLYHKQNYVDPTYWLPLPPVPED